MTCPACLKYAIDPFSGLYMRDCVECGARAVRAAPKVRKVQEQVLQFFREIREQIVERLKS